MSMAAISLRWPVRWSNQVFKRNISSSSRFHNRCFFSRDEVLIPDRNRRIALAVEHVRRVRILTDLYLQSIHAARRGVLALGQFLALAAQHKRAAVARANEETFLRLIVHRAAEMRTSGRKGIDFIAVTADQPDAADDVVGMQRPCVLA